MPSYEYQIVKKIFGSAICYTHDSDYSDIVLPFLCILQLLKLNNIHNLNLKICIREFA